MLPKQHRVDKNLFKEVFASGKHFSEENISLIYKPNDELRFTVVVPKKVEKRAVKRNSIRRRVKSTLPSLAHSFKEGTYIFIIRNNKKMSREVYEDDIKKLLSKVS